MPTVDKEIAPKIFRDLHHAIKQGLILSCHDLSEGGLAVAAAEMAFAGGVGVEINLKGGSTSELFSESNTRFLVEVAVSSEESFLKCVDTIVVAKTGQTTSGKSLVIKNAGQIAVDATLVDLKSAWQSPLNL